jgi:uncharacterized protein
MKRALSTISILFALTQLEVGPAGGGEVFFNFSDSLRLNKKIASWKEIRDQGIIKQKYDYSCGSGALATLMNLGFGEAVKEEDIIDLIVEDKSPEELAEIIQKGYSLLDLKKAAEKRGYVTSLVQLQIHHLYKLQGPVLIYFEPDGEKHFTVLKKVTGTKVYLADPAGGNVRISLFRFRQEWPGYVLAIDKK